METDRRFKVNVPSNPLSTSPPLPAALLTCLAPRTLCRGSSCPHLGVTWFLTLAGPEPWGLHHFLQQERAWGPLSPWTQGSPGLLWPLVACTWLGPRDSQACPSSKSINDKKKKKKKTPQDNWKKKCKLSYFKGLSLFHVPFREITEPLCRHKIRGFTDVPILTPPPGQQILSFSF